MILKLEMSFYLFKTIIKAWKLNDFAFCSKEPGKKLVIKKILIYNKIEFKKESGMKKFLLYFLSFIGTVFYFLSSLTAFNFFKGSFIRGKMQTPWMVEAGLQISYAVCMLFFLVIGACLAVGFYFISKNKLKSFCWTATAVCLSLLFFGLVSDYKGFMFLF